MAFVLRVLFAFVAIIFIHSTNGCPNVCVCNSTISTVICSDFTSTWNQILVDIPANTRKLYLKNGEILEKVTKTDKVFNPHGAISEDVPSLPKVLVVHISSTKLPMEEKIFQPFRLAEELHLVYNSLEKLDNVEVFHDLTNIKVLNLSHNSLQGLDNNLFKHMGNLKVLDLSFNRLNNLPHDIFEVLEDLKSLHINDNELEYIHPNSIGNLTSLHTLRIDSNALETLHESALPQNMSSFTRLKLQGNPWDCNCGLVWLSALLRDNGSADLFHDSQSIQCYYPLELRGQPIRSLTSENMKCEAPRIMQHPPANISIQRVHSHMLHCNATGDPAPAIYWLTPNGIFAQPNHRKYISPQILELAQRLDFKGIPTYRDSSMEVLSNGTLRFRQVRWYYAGQYACVAENPGGITMFYVHVKIHEVLRTYIWISMIYGAVLSIGFFIIAMIYASLKLLVEKTCLRRRMKEKADSIISSIEDIEPPSTPLFEGYLSPDWSRDFYISPRYSPTKCVTPSGEDFESRMPIKETLEDVRVRLHKSVEKQKEKIRTRAQRVKESSSQYMQNIKESSSVKMQTIKESSSQYVRNIRSSGTHAIQGIRSSSSQYAHRVRAGVVMGVEQVKYHVQSMREFCGTGDIGQTISTVSISTNVDLGDRSEVIKQITYV